MKIQDESVTNPAHVFRRHSQVLAGDHVAVVVIIGRRCVSHFVDGVHQTIAPHVALLTVACVECPRVLMIMDQQKPKAVSWVDFHG